VREVGSSNRKGIDIVIAWEKELMSGVFWKDLIYFIIDWQFVFLDFIWTDDVLNWYSLFWKCRLAFWEGPIFAVYFFWSYVLFVLFLWTKSMPCIFKNFFFCGWSVTLYLYIILFHIFIFTVWMLYSFFHWNIWFIIIMVVLTFILLLRIFSIFSFLFFCFAPDSWQ